MLSSVAVVFLGGMVEVECKRQKLRQHLNERLVDKSHGTGAAYRSNSNFKKSSRLLIFLTLIPLSYDRYARVVGESVTYVL